MSVLRQFALWLMLLSLIGIQAHNLVPHHHHASAAPVHGHTLDHLFGFGEDVDHTASLDCPHPETAPHDEPSISDAGLRRAQHHHFAMVIPEPIKVALPETTCIRHRVPIYAEHPHSTGPPLAKSPRAPPATLTA